LVHFVTVGVAVMQKRFTVKVFGEDGSLLDSDQAGDMNLACEDERILLARYPMTARSVILFGDEIESEIQHVPLSPEGVYLGAAKAFAEGRSFRKGDVAVTINAGHKRFYHIYAGPTDRKYYPFSFDEILAESPCSDVLRLNCLNRKECADHFSSEFLRARYNDILKAYGSTTRIVEMNGKWRVANDCLERWQWQPFGPGRLKINLTYLNE